MTNVQICNCYSALILYCSSGYQATMHSLRSIDVSRDMTETVYSVIVVTNATELLQKKKERVFT